MNKLSKKRKMRMWFLVQNENFPFPFLFLGGGREFLLFFYAYGGLHRWSTRREKIARVRFGSQRKQKKKKVIKKKKSVKHNLTNYFKKNFQILIFYLVELILIIFIITSINNKKFNKICIIFNIFLINKDIIVQLSIPRLQSDIIAQF